MGAKLAKYPDGVVSIYSLLIVLMAFSVVCSWVFFRFCERPFINAATHPSQPVEAFQASPAPTVV